MSRASSPINQNRFGLVSSALNEVLSYFYEIELDSLISIMSNSVIVKDQDTHNSINCPCYFMAMGNLDNSGFIISGFSAKLIWE